MASYGMVIHLDRCTGCYACMLACRDEHWENDHLPYAVGQPLRDRPWISLIEKERGQLPRVKLSYIPRLCVQCGDAPCVNASTGGAVYRREDGLVLIDPIKAQGRTEIVSSCPHRAISWNEERGLPQKCTLCAHLLDRGWKEPRCVEACPTGALIFGDLEEEGGEVSRWFASAAAEELHPEYALSPRIKYVGLPKRFVAGTVVLGDVDECGVGAQVDIKREGWEASTVANGFGDFEFEGLEVGKYLLEVRLDGYHPLARTVSTIVDSYIGEIVLSKNP